MSNSLELGDRLGKAIADSKYKAREVAEHVGISPQAISKAIRSHSMGKDNLRKIAEFVGVNEDWLINGKVESKGEFDAALMARCTTVMENASKEAGLKNEDREKFLEAVYILYEANR